MPAADFPSVADNPQSLLSAIIESSNDAVISKNLEAIVTTWNPAASRIFGYSAHEMIGQSILRLIPPELHHEEDTILAKVRAGERTDHYETTRIRKDGERIDVSVTISPVRDSSGRIIGASKIARDVSDRKRVEQLLIQSEKLAATGRMAATVAHEINNPLESVMNLIYLARKCSSSRGKAFVYLQSAEKELERVSHIARKTLGYYRETGSPVEVQINTLLADVLSVYETRLLASGIAVDCRFDDHPPVVVNKGEILQVFSNVIANAVDAMPQGGNLVIEVRETIESEQKGILVVVRDQGMGIPQEHLERVFEPFFSTKGNLGTGIGLWVSRQLIERHGGRIALASNTAPDTRGTTVHIFIPLHHENQPKRPL